MKSWATQHLTKIFPTEEKKTSGRIPMLSFLDCEKVCRYPHTRSLGEIGGGSHVGAIARGDVDKAVDALKTSEFPQEETK